MGKMPSFDRPGATNTASSTYTAVVGIPMPRIMLTMAVSTSSNSALLWPILSSVNVSVNPRPVSCRMPMTTPASPVIAAISSMPRPALIRILRISCQPIFTPGSKNSDDQSRRAANNPASSGRRLRKNIQTTIPSAVRRNLSTV